MLDRGIAALREGQVSITAVDWLSFLYNDEPFDITAFNRGLLRGPFLLKV